VKKVIKNFGEEGH